TTPEGDGVLTPFGYPKRHIQMEAQDVGSSQGAFPECVGSAGAVEGGGDSVFHTGYGGGAAARGLGRALPAL
ncbi:MAG: hypothetical protein RIM80_23935, partial [Alphaproteobacteria bacterium]